MNFLGLSFRNHDANISYSSEKKIKYIKFEREFNQKHFEYFSISHRDIHPKICGNMLRLNY